MNSTTVAIDLAKNVFELAVAGADWRIGERHRLSRAKFDQFFVNRPPCNVVMEACGSAHYWARRIVAAGHDVRLGLGVQSTSKVPNWDFRGPYHIDLLAA